MECSHSSEAMVVLRMSGEKEKKLWEADIRVGHTKITQGGSPHPQHVQEILTMGAQVFIQVSYFMPVVSSYVPINIIDLFPALQKE